MLDAAPPRYRAMLWLMAGCGLRLGEAMAVSRDQIDFKAETLRVDFQIAEDGDTESGKNSAIQRRHIKSREEGEPGRSVPSRRTSPSSFGDTSRTTAYGARNDSSSPTSRGPGTSTRRTSTRRSGWRLWARVG